MEQMGTLSVSDIAGRLGVDSYTVRRWIKAGKLVAVKESNRGGYRIEAEDYLTFLDNNPRYTNDRKHDLELKVRSDICQALMIELYNLQKKFLCEEHGKVYSDGWNDAMTAFDAAIKRELVDVG